MLLTTHILNEILTKNLMLNRIFRQLIKVAGFQGYSFHECQFLLMQCHIIMYYQDIGRNSAHNVLIKTHKCSATKKGEMEEASDRLQC